MSAPQLLFACSRCFSRHPFEELSSGQQLCKECRGTFPVVKCTYCRTEFQQTAKGSTSTICKKCEQNVKAYGKPSACEYCNIIAAFIGNKCQRCTNSELKYGPPVTCEQCKQKCAFEKPRDNDDKKLEDIYSGGKLLCWLCALAYKRALARTKQSDADRRAHLKMTQKRDAKHRDHNRLKSHNKRPHRVDLTKQSSNEQGNGSGNGNDNAPPNKVSRSGSGGGGGGGAGSGLPGGRAAPIGEFDPNSSDHVVAMTQLKEKIASLQKLVSQKDSLILTKDKMITELKAKHFTVENELRNQMKVTQRDHDNKCDMLNGKIQTLLKEVATLSKSTKKDRLAAARESSTNSGSGTDSPSIP